MDLNQEVTLFRLAQEAVNNARKHAQAKMIAFAWSSLPAVTLVVEDDGRGFQPFEAGNWRALGSSGCGNGRSLSTGTLVTSAPGQGTRVRVRVPLAKGDQGWAIRVLIVMIMPCSGRA